MTGIRLENSTEVLYNVHDPAKCADRACAIHNRSTHHMRSWPQHFRGDRGLMERYSPLGGGHPDRDDLDWRPDPGSASIHGCILHPFTGRGICSKWEWDGSPAAFLHGFPGYAVTKDGRIWSWHPDDEYDVDWNHDPEEVPVTEKRGAHPKVSMMAGGDGEWTERFVRDVVWLAWHGERPKGYRITHEDGDRFNNSVENLILVGR